MQNQAKKNAAFLMSLLSAIVLFGGLWFNWPLNFSRDAVDHFDDWSHGIMISDLIYQDNYGESLFVQSISPTTLNKLGYTDTIGVLENAFIEEQSFPLETFGAYTSNVCIHGHIYRLLNAVLPISNRFLILLLKFICCAWTAAMLGMILYWIAWQTAIAIPLIVSVILAIACPLFTMYGTNLYWCAGNLFFPMAIMTSLMRSRKFHDGAPRQQCVKLALTAFVTCVIKQLLYFEFVSSVMIAMTIPLIYWLIAAHKKYMDWVFYFGATIAGAVVSFLTAFSVRLVLLVISFGWQRATEIIFQNFSNRILGTEDASNTSPRILESAEASYTLVLGRMLNRPCISIGNIRITMIQMMWICGVCVVGYFLLSRLYCRHYEKRGAVSKSWFALTIATAISALAPLSWFILAKPHTYIHEIHCSFVWFCPFVFMMLALIGETLKQTIALIVQK